jgi:hypothetical protein
MRAKRILMFFLLMMIFLVSSFIVSAQTSGHIKTTFLNQDPDPAQPGKYVELRWKVEKLGTEKLEDVTFMLETEYPFYLDSGETSEKKIGTWFGTSDDDEFYTLYYRVRVESDALEGNYDLKLKYKTKSDSTWVGETYSIRVGDKEISKFVLGTLVTSPSKLTRDINEAELDIEIQNIGDGNAENVIATLNLLDFMDSTYGYSERSNLGLITAGTSKTAKFYVDLDESVNGGSYETNLTINYKDSTDEDNEYKQIILPVLIPIMNKPNFEIEGVEITPKNPSSQDNVQIKLTLKNIGGEDADSVSIRAFKESSQPFEFEDKSDFIGNIDANQTGEGIITLDIDKNALAKKYFIDIEIRSIDGNEVVLQDKTIELELYDSESNNLKFIFVGLGIILILGLVFYIYKIKK